MLKSVLSACTFFGVRIIPSPASALPLWDLWISGAWPRVPVTIHTLSIHQPTLGRTMPIVQLDLLRLIEKEAIIQSSSDVDSLDEQRKRLPEYLLQAGHEQDGPGTLFDDKTQV